MSATKDAERIVVLIDNNSLFKALHGLGIRQRIDYRKFLRWLLDGKSAAVARFYTGEIRNDNSVRANFYGFLKSIGFEVVTLHEPRSSADHAALDTTLRAKVHSIIQIDMDAFRRDCDKLVLVSGSQELACKVAELTELGVDVEVVFFEQTCSEVLRLHASRFRELCNLKFTKRLEREKVLT